MLITVQVRRRGFASRVRIVEDTWERTQLLLRIITCVARRPSPVSQATGLRLLGSEQRVETTCGKMRGGKSGYLTAASNEMVRGAFAKRDRFASRGQQSTSTSARGNLERIWIRLQPFDHLSEIVLNHRTPLDAFRSRGN